MGMSDVGQGITSGAMTRSEFGEQDTSESYFENNIEPFHLRFVNLRTDYTTVVGSPFIWGNPVYGIWGSYLWSASNGTPARVREDFMWMDYKENFATTTYKDPINTTGVGWGTGSVLFVTAINAYNFTAGSYTSSVGVSAGSIQLT